MVSEAAKFCDLVFLTQTLNITSGDVATGVWDVVNMCTFGLDPAVEYLAGMIPSLSRLVNSWLGS